MSNFDKPAYAETRAKLEKYNITALEENFTEMELPYYAFLAFETLFKSEVSLTTIKARVKKKYELYATARNPAKTPIQETYEVVVREMLRHGVAVPTELIAWRDSIEPMTNWFRLTLWKKAVHLLLMSEDEYSAHRSYKIQQA